MATDISRGVQAMEEEAARILDDARAKANDIVQKAREESRSIAGSELSLDDVKAQAAKIVDEAKKKAADDAKGADKRSAEIKANAGKKVDEYAKLMVGIVTGEKTA
jgi:F0F1-type ATP synthase membrane subunit b/b'